MFDRLEEHGLVVKVEKCLFGVSEIDFLGHRVSCEGIRPLPTKVQAITKFPTPSTVKQLEQFIGMMNFYHVFIPKAAEVMKPLYQALSGTPRPKDLEWSAELDQAFVQAKEHLAGATLLHHPIPGAVTALTTDASDTAIGAVLEQRVGNHWQPLAFFSRQLNKAERNYATTDRELLGIHAAIIHFRYFLEGRPFTVFTDHRPIVAAIKKKTELKSGRQSRHLATVSEYTTDVQHVSGKDNVVADALSRSPVPDTPETPHGFHPETGFLSVPICAALPGLDYRAIAQAQQEDPDTQNYRTAITNLRFEDVPFDKGVFTLLCDISTGKARPVIPEPWRKRVFESVHSLSHPGVRTTKRIVASKFVWHGMAKQITEWARTCIKCQRAKVHRHTRAPLAK
ncbi:MAG: RNase H-like domain-containing protein, partial [Verrucomicrobiota bacterium]|nr:RNase H-like domain-containing protein [Verrucomicrobiota bacterium]